MDLCHREKTAAQLLTDAPTPHVKYHSKSTLKAQDY